MIAKKLIKNRAYEDKLAGKGDFGGPEFTVSLKLASETTSDITKRLLKRGIAANS
jgi:hypothetical protein